MNNIQTTYKRRQIISTIQQRKLKVSQQVLQMLDSDEEIHVGEYDSLHDVLEGIASQDGKEVYFYRDLICLMDKA